MDRSGDERNANWRGESSRNAWNRERDDWQQSNNWRGRPAGEVERSLPGAAPPAPLSAFRGSWGNTGGFSESFYNRGMTPYEPGVGGLEALESHWPSRQARGWAAPPNAEWPDAAPRSVASAAAEAEHDWPRDDRAWSRQPSWWGNAPPNWSNQHVGIAEPTWGGGSSRRERDWGDAPNSWNRGAAGREWGTQPDWSSRLPAADGPFRGRGPQGYQRSDERIREDICDMLTERGDIDASTVHVRVENREVTLDGSVPDRRMKRIAEDVAESARGVRDVHNRLRVESDRGDARAHRDDAWSAAGSRDAARSSRAGSRNPDASARGANASSRGANASARGANASARGANAPRGAASRGGGSAPGRSSRSASNAAGRSGSRSRNAASTRDRDPNAPARGSSNRRSARDR